MITRIKFSAGEAARRGLKTVELRGLGPLVVLAGPNGGGKTRHIDLVRAAIESHTTSRCDHEIDDTTSGEWLHAVVVRYAPNVKQTHPELIGKSTSDDLLRYIRGGSYEAVAQGLHVYLEAIARALWNRDHPRAVQFPYVENYYAVARRFNEVIDRLLGTTVEAQPEESGRVVPLLFGQPYASDRLSVGEIVLLCWAVLLVQQSGHYMNKIVLLDEPEVYLHPDICIQAIKRLQSLLGANGQIWIATHSLPLIAWAGTESLYFVEDGAAVYARSTPSSVWRSLLGGEQNRDELLSFLDGDVDAAAIRFAAECLLGPTVASERSNDPQAEQLDAVIATQLQGGVPVRVLEIGAGRGRLVHAIIERLATDRSLPPERLTYIAYQEPRFLDPSHQASCERHLAALRSLGAQARYSTNFAELQARATDRVDLVVLANTLHEIPVQEWIPLFENIQRMGNSDATLLVIEDQQPSVGELPHPQGFLILERHEWRALVDAEVQEKSSLHDGRRLTAFEISVASLKNVNPKSLADAVTLVRDRAIGEVEQLRAQSPSSYKVGRKHAFYAMLHLNATLVLRSLGAARHSDP